jgi:predicted dehydrogenase
MRQVLQSLADGTTLLVEVPEPRARSGHLLIRTVRTLISAGTERMLVDFGRAGWIDKARQQPEKVRQVLDKVRTDGLSSTIEAVRSKLDQPIPLGYCNVGVVVEVGADIAGFASGDRVVSNGAHAETINAPRTLCARIPDNVSDDEAAFVVLGAIALQGIRLAAPTLGERVVVIGLGLIGLLTVQLLIANGCRVLGVDPDTAKAMLAKQFGAEIVALEAGEDVLTAAHAFSAGRGVDAVIITAATHSNEPMSQAAQMSRKRGRIVLVGVTGLQLDRADFYRKELSFQLSCSYGPGRYDPDYEEKGNDYPFGFVRWTEQRNFEAVLDMMSLRRLDVRPLISHRFALEAAGEAYELLATGHQPYLGILLEYPAPDITAARSDTVKCAARAAPANIAPGLAFIGSGNYAGRFLIPAFAAAGASLRGIASSGGVTAAYYARKFGFERATTDAEGLIRAPDVNAVVVATRHDSHARFALQALQGGKHVFVEKPLALRSDELDAIESAWAASASGATRPCLMVGFNRRFAPHVVRMRGLLAGVREPKNFIITVNAGSIPAEHWTQDPAVGGGRILGEACHFIDLLRFLAGQSVKDFQLAGLGGASGGLGDNATITLRFADGSCGSVFYFSNGHRAFPKERIEVFCAGRSLHLDNFRCLRGHGWAGFDTMNLWRQNKGQAACARAFLEAIRTGGPEPIPFQELLEVARTTIAVAEAMRT